MNAYLIIWDESDGNDCTVYDTVIEAESEGDALSKLADAMEAQFEANGTSYQEDGNFLGYYFGCDEDCPDECDGHGGISLREVETYASESEARNNMSKWHREYSV